MVRRLAAYALRNARGEPLLPGAAQHPSCGLRASYFAPLKGDIIPLPLQVRNAPPSPWHVNGLAQPIKAVGVNAILTESFRSQRFSRLLASQSGARVVVLPAGVGAEKGIDDYFTLMTAWVDRVAAAL